MAKAKTKRIPFDNLATEVEPGAWEFEIHGQKWRWENQMGLNFGPCDSQGLWHGQLRVARLDLAGMFAEGFHAGATHQEQTRKED